MARGRFFAAVCALALTTLSGGVGAQAAPAPAPSAGTAGPSVTGPITGGNGVPVIFGHTSFDLATVGYTQSEFFLSGTATAYAPTTALTSDGTWSAAPAAEAPYTTRIVVDRPARRRDFNGTVVVEWLNVSGGADASPDWIHTHDELIREGYAWVGVSAQIVGLNALKLPANGSPAFGDPVRYASLTHPGDSFSYDIFSQAGQAVRSHPGIILGGLRPRHVLGVGESQSAGRLVTYVDAVHPLAHVYDGFLIHSRGVNGAPLSQAPLAAVGTPVPSRIRTDLDVPVLQFETETDLLLLGFVGARQPDTDRITTWEVAGTAHFDLYGLVQGATDTGRRSTAADWFDSMQHPTNQPGPNFTCGVPINSGPQTFVLRAAVASLDAWVARGTPPPRSPRLETTSTTPPQLVLDADGNARGGIRTPAVDAPVATLSGMGQTGGTSFCNIFGTTVPLTGERLTARYQSRFGFAWAWTVATLQSYAGGFLRPRDAWQLWLVGLGADPFSAVASAG